MNSQMSVATLKWLVFLFGLLLTGLSFYFEYGQGLLPCPLCIMQRLAVMLILFFAMLGLWFSTPKASKRVAWSQLVFIIAGAGFAIRQLYLQSLPPELMPSCGPGLNVLIQYFPWQDVVHAIFYGTGDCGEVSWSLLGLSMAAWSLVSFIILSLLSSVLLFSLSRSKD